MKMKRWQTVALVFGLTLLPFWGSQAQEKYPSRPIALVVPTAPGGSMDTSVRIYTDELARLLKVPIIVVNRAGGTGIEGTVYVQRAKKDGYTLIQGSENNFIKMPIFNKEEVTYDPLKDFTPLAHYVTVPSVFAVNVNSPFKTLGELVEYARKNPGKLKNGVAGILSGSHFNMEVLCSTNKIVIKTVPFEGAGAPLAALLGGHIDLATLSLTTLAPHIMGGKLRGLAVTSKTRHFLLPNISTTTELGYPEADFLVWNGAYAPAGIPQSVLDILIPAFEKVFKNPEVVNRAKKAGLTVEYMNPEQLRKFMVSQIQRVKKLAQEANLLNK